MQNTHAQKLQVLSSNPADQADPYCVSDAVHEGWIQQLGRTYMAGDVLTFNKAAWTK